MTDRRMMTITMTSSMVLGSPIQVDGRPCELQLERVVHTVSAELVKLLNTAPSAAQNSIRGATLVSRVDARTNSLQSTFSVVINATGVPTETKDDTPDMEATDTDVR